MNDLKTFSEKLIKEESVAVFCHIRPDGDALGSAAALKRALNCLGKRCEAFCSDVIPEKFMFSEGFHVFNKQYSNNGFSDFSALIAVDCADITRLGEFADAFSKHKNTYNIDHHVSNNFFAKHNYVFDAASNAENIFALISQLGIKPDVLTAELLMTGVLTDTGGFRHKNVTPNTFLTAAELLRAGADVNKISYIMFSEQSKERALLFGKTMSKLRYFYNGRLCIATVRADELKESGADASETEGFIDFVMGIDCVEVGICLMETAKNKFKASFRSKKADVNAIAQTFGGGGHVLASGCMLCCEYEEAVDKLRFAVSQYLED